MSKFKIGDKVRTVGGAPWAKDFQGVDVVVVDVNDTPAGNQYLITRAQGGTTLNGISTEFVLVDRPTPDTINPDHYSGDLVMRVIEERSLDFAMGNAVKYLCRAGSKPGSSRKQDLLKAQWYLNRAIEREEAAE